MKRVSIIEGVIASLIVFLLVITVMPFFHRHAPTTTVKPVDQSNNGEPSSSFSSAGQQSYSGKFNERRDRNEKGQGLRSSARIRDSQSKPEGIRFPEGTSGTSSFDWEKVEYVL